MPNVQSELSTINANIKVLSRKIDSVITQLMKQEKNIMATLDKINAAVAAMELEVNAAVAELKDLASKMADPTVQAQADALADRLTAAHDALKAEVDADASK